MVENVSNATVLPLGTCTKSKMSGLLIHCLFNNTASVATSKRFWFCEYQNAREQFGYIYLYIYVERDIDIDIYMYVR